MRGLTDGVHSGHGVGVGASHGQSTHDTHGGRTVGDLRAGGIVEAVAGDRRAVRGRRAERHTRGAGAHGLGLDVRRRVRLARNGHRDGALHDARRIAELVVDLVAHGDRARRARGDHDRRPGGCDVRVAEGDCGSDKRDRRVREGVGGARGNVDDDGLPDLRVHGVRRHLDARLRRRHDLDGDRGVNGVALLVGDTHGDGTGGSSGRVLGGGDRQDGAVEACAHGAGSGSHRVGEGRGISTLGVTHGEREVLGDGAAAGLDTDRSRGEGGRLVRRGLDAHGQRQRGTQRTRVVSIAVRDLNEERGVAAERGGRSQGQLRRRVGHDRVQAGLDNRGRSIDEAGAAARSSDDVVRQIDCARGASVHLDGQASGTEEGRGGVASGHVHDGGVGLTVAVGNRVDDEAQGVGNRDQQVGPINGDARFCGRHGQLVDAAVGVLVVLQDLDTHG